MNFTVAKFKLQPFWQEEDRKEALKAFRDVFKRQAPLHGLSWFFFFFFLNKDKIWVLWKAAQAQGFVYLPGQREWKGHVAAQSDLQGVSCYLSCHQGPMSTSLNVLHESVQHHRCFSTGKHKATSWPSAGWHASLWMADPPKLIPYRQCHQMSVIHSIGYRHKCQT